MRIISVKFKGSIYNFDQIYNNNIIYPEYAFAGRSNVGKSSLINWITNTKKLAKVSSIPGKTKYINFFLINNKWFLIDLPGYGYVLNNFLKKKTNNLVKNYIFKRRNLLCLFLLIDSSIPIQKIDVEFIKMLHYKNIKFKVIFTKIDKLSYIKINKNIISFINYIQNKDINFPQWFKITIKKENGKKKIINNIQNMNYKKKLIIPNS